MLQAYNENGPSIHKLNETMTSFMKKMLAQFDEGQTWAKLLTIAPIAEVIGALVVEGNLGPTNVGNHGNGKLEATIV